MCYNEYALFIPLEKKHAEAPNYFSWKYIDIELVDNAERIQASLGT